MIFKALVFLALGVAAGAQSFDDALLQGIKVTSGRSSASAQFNMPAVRLWLPRLPNSAYATQKFAKPSLWDAQGQPVEFQLERGLYSHELWKDEIRLQPKGEAARVVGTIKIRYPVKLRESRSEDQKKQLTEPATFVKLPAVFVEEWKEVEISYDLPLHPKLSDSEMGKVQQLPASVADTPGGKVVVTVKP